MRIRRLKYILWSAAVAFTAGGVVLIAWAACVPLPMTVDQSALRRNSATGSTANPTSPIDARELEKLAQFDLRRPLHDAPPAPAPLAQAIPPLDIRLTGTIFEPGYSRAMIQLADGSVQLKAVGDLAGAVRITDIEKGSIRVDYYGQSQELAVVKETINQNAAN